MAENILASSQLTAFYSLSLSLSEKVKVDYGL